VASVVRRGLLLVPGVSLSLDFPHLVVLSLIVSAAINRF
jgi:hypothetical protein